MRAGRRHNAAAPWLSAAAIALMASNATGPGTASAAGTAGTASATGAPGAPGAASTTVSGDGTILVEDDLHRDIVLPRSPRRIVSLSPALTETVCALGECARLIAADRYSNWPDTVSSLPKAGGLEDPQIETIVSLHPDLVLLSSTRRTIERLRGLGVESVALDTDTYAHITRVITAIGTVLGVSDRASALNRRIDADIREIGSEVLARRRGATPSVYYEVDGGPYAAGPESFIGELLTRLGTRNIVDRDLGPFPKLNPEYVVRHDPDVIFTSPADVPRLAERPGWDRIRAVREHRICAFAPAINDTIVRAGPRIADGMRALADCLARVSP